MLVPSFGNTKAFDRRLKLGKEKKGKKEKKEKKKKKRELALANVRTALSTCFTRV